MALRIAVAALVVTGFSAQAQLDPNRLLADLPGFDFSRLSAPAKRELAAVLTDEFDFCGRPLTLYASLKKGDACKHTKRLVSYAAELASDGTSAMEIINALGRHSVGFTKPRATFKLDDRQCTGPKDAKVTLVEFSDFQCPHCAAARPVLEGFVAQRPALRLCWLPFSLPHFPQSALAMQAALFARDKGKFWPMHDALFDNQQSFSETFIKQLVVKQGLELKAFEKALETKKYVPEIEAGRDAGRKAGVDSTPSLFVNGRKHALGFNVESLSLSAEDEADWSASSGSWPSN